MARSEELEFQKIDLVCSKCGARTQKTVGYVRSHDEYACSRCHDLAQIDMETVKPEIERIKAELREHQHSLWAKWKRETESGGIW
ncbi:MAG: hypothetical protein U9N14_04310 [Pseudomonadota bacterium]|nr:hypothetical protein [Pseudomonadota bacterium]